MQLVLWMKPTSRDPRWTFNRLGPPGKAIWRFPLPIRDGRFDPKSTAYWAPPLAEALSLCRTYGIRLLPVIDPHWDAPYHGRPPVLDKATVRSFTIESRDYIVDRGVDLAGVELGNEMDYAPKLDGMTREQMFALYLERLHDVSELAPAGTPIVVGGLSPYRVYRRNELGLSWWIGEQHAAGKVSIPTLALNWHGNNFTRGEFFAIPSIAEMTSATRALQQFGLPVWMTEDTPDLDIYNRGIAARDVGLEVYAPMSLGHVHVDPAWAAPEYEFIGVEMTGYWNKWNTNVGQQCTRLSKELGLFYEHPQGEEEDDGEEQEHPDLEALYRAVAELRSQDQQQVPPFRNPTAQQYRAWLAKLYQKRIERLEGGGR